jgi:predicted ester cyclase
MSVEENKGVYRRFVEEVINGGNLAAIDELFSPDYVDHDAPPGAPLGLAGVRLIPTMFRGAFPDVHFQIERLVGEGDLVATHVTGHGTHQGPFMGVPPTGRHVSWGSMGIFRVLEGKIVEHWGIPDLLSLMRQIGAIPSPAQAPDLEPSTADGHSG